MKARELVAWALLLIALALLLRSCKHVDEVLFPGTNDTIVIADTIIVERLIDKPVPYAVYYYTSDTVDHFIDGLSDYYYPDTKSDCDSVRLYADSVSNTVAKTVVNSTVRGELLNQKIRLESYSSDTVIHRTDTLIKVVPAKLSFTLTGAFDTKYGIGIGADLGVKRWSFGYAYFPAGGQQVRVGYRIFGK